MKPLRVAGQSQTVSPSDVLCEIIIDATLCHPRSSPQWRLCCFYLSRHPLFISASVNFIPLHLPPCSLSVTLLLSSHFSDKQHPWLSLVRAVIDDAFIDDSSHSRRHHRFTNGSLLYFLYYSCLLLFFQPFYLLSKSHRLAAKENIVFLFIGQGLLSWYPQQQTCFFFLLFFFHNAEIKGASETLIVLVMRAKRYGFSLVFKDVITAVRLCFH